MNKKQIDDMMRAQPYVLHSETLAEKWIAGICAVIAFLILCFVA